MNPREMWQRRTDEQVLEAAANLAEYTASGQQIIKAEMLSRGLSLPVGGMQKRLHIYGQETWHGPAFLVGSRDALEALQEAIQEALAADAGIAATPSLFPSDDEGYQVVVVRMEDPDRFALLANHYTAEPARPKEREGLAPWDLSDEIAGVLREARGW